MKFEIHCQNKKLKKFLELLMPSMLAQLKLSNSKQCLLISVSSECEESGVTVPLPGINGYFMGIKPPRRGIRGLFETSRTLAHELVHVRQMAKGVLKPVKNGNLWAGKFYPTSTPYLDRPWEIQAYQMQELVMRRAIE